MKSTLSLSLITSLIIFSGNAFAIPCPFNSAKSCTLQRDILNDTKNGMNYYGTTNFDHRSSGEINVYSQELVVPYQDNVNAPGQLKFLLKATPGNPPFKTGEIMTRANMRAFPINGPKDINPWTTKDLKHGYLEVIAKLPKCDSSSDGKCQNGSADQTYNKGLWPAIWMMPTYDAEWPKNGEIDLMEAYQQNTNFKNYTIYLHFKGSDSRCGWGDCVNVGLQLASVNSPDLLYDKFNTWGFEWEPDPKSSSGGVLLTTYLNGQVTSGPMSTDTLPADGKDAYSRGFNDPNGGFYLIVNLAVGGGYAGAPHPNLTGASMYVRSIKTYDVGGGSGPTPTGCKGPASIQQLVSNDKRQLTLAWDAPTGSSDVTGYKVHDWQDKLMWSGTQRFFQDGTLPGTSGTFTYNLYTVCKSGTSPKVVYNAQVN